MASDFNVILIYATAVYPNTQNTQWRGTALCVAASYKHEDVIELLLEAKAKPDLQNKVCSNITLCGDQPGVASAWPIEYDQIRSSLYVVLLCSYVRICILHFLGPSHMHVATMSKSMCGQFQHTNDVTSDQRQ